LSSVSATWRVPIDTGMEISEMPPARKGIKTNHPIVFDGVFPNKPVIFLNSYSIRKLYGLPSFFSSCQCQDLIIFNYI
jgi:hypothetical protein